MDSCPPVRTLTGAFRFHSWFGRLTLSVQVIYTDLDAPDHAGRKVWEPATYNDVEELKLKSWNS